jgi:gamma-glutamylcyclotransferase (GGCT)/AIG2-like uncharacterized protein YtfP
VPLLFSYGTLQQDKVQLSTFGRLLAGRPDAIVGFAQSSVTIDDPQVVAALGEKDHINVVFNGNDASRVPGTVFEVTDAQLASADEYEQAASYRRVVARLASGAPAWVYTHAGAGAQPTRPVGWQESSNRRLSMKLNKNLGMLLLGIWLILTGVIPLLHLSFSGLGTLMALLAIASGALIAWSSKDAAAI